MILIIALLTAALSAIQACLLYGTVSELTIAAVTRYRRFGCLRIALCGLAAALLSMGFAFARYPLPSAQRALLPTLWMSFGGVAPGYGALAGIVAGRLRRRLALEW